MPTSGNILIIGGASVDTIIHLDSLPEPRPQTIWPKRSYRVVGSTGAGKALNLARLGQSATLHTLLGQDTEADLIRQSMQDAGVALIEDITGAPTEQHVNLMDANGGRISFFTHPPADPENLDWSAIRPALHNASVIVINILGYVKQVLPLLRKQEKPVWTDLHDYDGNNPYHQAFIDAADVVFLSSDNLSDYRTVMQTIISQDKRRVVCTHGSQGATLLNDQGQWLEQAVIPASPVRDTNGAGDAFFSGFLWAHLQGFGDQECLRYAAACGSLCVEAEALANDNLSPDVLRQRAQAREKD